MLAGRMGILLSRWKFNHGSGRKELKTNEQGTSKTAFPNNTSSAGISTNEISTSVSNLRIFGFIAVCLVHLTVLL